jgi:hypothetical protein
MDGVTSVTDGAVVGVTMRPHATWVASWDNSTPLIATYNNNVVGVNIFAFDGGSYTGDVALIFHNSIVWLLGLVPENVLIFTGNDGYTDFYSNLSSALTNIGKSTLITDIFPTFLDGFCTVYLSVNKDPFTIDQTASLVNYVNNGGMLVAIGETEGFGGTANAVMNDLAEALGSTMRIVPDSIDPGCRTTTLIEPHHLTAGVSELAFGSTSLLDVGSGSLLASTDSHEEPMLGVEQIGSGAFVLATDVNIFADLCWAGDNNRLVQNLCSFLECPTSFYVNFGTSPGSMDPICTDSWVNWCDPGPLEPDTTYYWSVSSMGCCYGLYGLIRSFTTAGAGCSLPGDINGDGFVTPGDAQMAFDHFLGLITLTPEQQECADVCPPGGDGFVTPGDAQGIFNIFLGISPPCD